MTLDFTSISNFVCLICCVFLHTFIDYVPDIDGVFIFISKIIGAAAIITKEGDKTIG